MLENIKEIKKRIAEDLLISIPQLTAFSQNKFYRILGCLIVGIEVVNIPNIAGYKPHFMVYPLWENSVKKCLDAPYISFSIENKKGLEFSIPYLKHSIYFEEVIECIEKQTPVLFYDSVTLKLLHDLVDSRFSDILVKSNSAQQVKLFEVKFYTALYTGSHTEVQNVLFQIQHASKSWNMTMFEMWYGKFDLWFEDLYEKIEKQEDFFKQIELNKQEKIISKLNISELVV